VNDVALGPLKWLNEAIWGPPKNRGPRLQPCQPSGKSGSASLPRSGSLKLSGKEFQSDGSATEKARGPSVLSRHRGTTKRR